MKYEKPSINKIEFNMFSKHGHHMKSQKIRSEIDAVKVDELTKEYGSPLFVFSQRKIEELYFKTYNAFSSRYPNVQFAWSYKTNYLSGICQLMHNLGSLAEVVSEMEYEKAKALKVADEDIIFNGPYKPKEALKRAVQGGAKIHIDHLFEINDLEEIADELNMRIPVAIRVNMFTGTYPQWDKFGFNYENSEAYNAVKRIFNTDKLYLTGLHTHIGTFILDANAYSLATTKIMKLKALVEKDFNYNIEYIDMGGGFASKSYLKGVYQSPEVVIPTVEEYANAITSAIYENNQSETLPKLYMELGRYLIDEAGYLLSTVTAYKRFANAKKGYIMDAGVNLLYTSQWYNFIVELDKYYAGTAEPSVLNGPLCMNIDVIEDNIALPPLNRGSILTFSPVGAYNLSQSMQFIRYRPAVVLIDKSSKVHLLKSAESLEQVSTTEHLPNYLNKP
jgi:diaminopimelate decarboxylase